MDIIGFVKKDYLLVISAILALFSLFLVPFDTVLSYSYERILDTICTLLLFLLIVAGLKECNALNVLAKTTLSNLRTTRALCLALILLPFFCAMLFSNDVALLTFIPLSIAILSMAKMRGIIIVVVVLQTIAANVGSYLTPFGNPHNLYIFNMHDYYGFDLWNYESKLIPIVIVGAITLLVITMLIKNKPLDVEMEDNEGITDKRILCVLIALFAVAIITVIDIIPFYITVIAFIVIFLVIMPSVFKKVNYSILFIFFFLFIFANGLTSMESIYNVINDLMAWDPMLTTVLVSQFTSNVPSTILLQPFTTDWAAVLVGANIGGFGTPIASMASIISLKFYLQEEDSSIKSYLKIFLLLNLVMLAVLIPTYYIFDC